MPALALAACAFLVAVLLYVERRASPSVSRSLWLPTLWVLLIASRPLGQWVTGGGEASLGNVGEGSFWDRTCLSAMIVVALATCARRGLPWSQFVSRNPWLLALFGYMALSAAWSDVPFVSLKRLVRSALPIVMAAVVLTEDRPAPAVRCLLRRCAYVLIPASVVLMKYYPRFGRSYGPWTGMEMWTGVATHKNGLGQLCAVSAVFLAWSLIHERPMNGKPADRWRRRADVGILGVTTCLLIGPGGGGYSATSIAVTVLGIAMCLACWQSPGWAGLATRKAELLIGGLAVTYLGVGKLLTAFASGALGRGEDLTGRATDIWPVVMQEALRHPLLGAGYGSAWGLGGKLSTATGLGQAHNGYLDVFLELGLVGVALLTGFLLSAGAKVREESKLNADWAVFALSLLLMAMFYNLSESAFFDTYLGGLMIVMAAVSGATKDEAAPERVRGLDDSRRPQPPRPTREATTEVGVTGTADRVTFTRRRTRPSLHLNTLSRERPGPAGAGSRRVPRQGPATGGRRR